MKTKAEYRSDNVTLKANLDNQIDIANQWKKKADKLQERVDDLTGLLHTVQLEAAELHGYVNRVEIEDDTAWYTKHRPRITEIDNHGKAHEIIAKPLCQRLRQPVYVADRDANQKSPGRQRARVAYDFNV